MRKVGAVRSGATVGRVDQERGAAPPTGRPPAARFDLERARLALAILGIAGGAVLWLVEAARWAELVWAATTVVGLVPLAVGIVRKAWRREPGVDLIALLAMAGALALGEYLAGAVIAVMLATGQTLEAFAEGRAHRELSALLERAPRTVQRYEDGRLVERPIGEVGVGDRLLVRTGEVVPVDGVAQGPAVLDESMLTGESRPVERGAGERVRSGAVNAGPSFDLRAIATAADSTYAGIVRLVEEAERDRAPIVRLADRYAFVFIPVTLLLAGAAWAFSGDPVRALAVLVVATPCPMILAVPIAIVAGTSRAARRGVIVKGGGSARDPRPRAGPAARQDRHDHRRPAGADRRRRVRRARSRRAPASGCLARPSLAARPGGGDRARRARPGSRARVPRAGPGALRRGDRRHGRGSTRGGRQGLLRGRRGAAAARRSRRAAPHDARRIVGGLRRRRRGGGGGRSCSTIRSDRTPRGSSGPCGASGSGGS
ncbi:MAG: hypothetical protein KatS3mg013_0692 [Actinomycetota bacterium]|nr:MAG: hypothetical protein KatS3mg013_0692 [Actinomycetota bacterium]